MQYSDFETVKRTKVLNSEVLPGTDRPMISTTKEHIVCPKCRKIQRIGGLEAFFCFDNEGFTCDRCEHRISNDNEV